MTAQSEAKRFSAQVGIVVFSRLLSGVAQLLTAVILTRLMDKEQVGVLMLLVTLAAAFNGIGTLGLPQSILYFVPNLTDGARRWLVRRTTAMLTGLGALAAGLLLLLIVGFGVFTEGKPGMAPLAGWVALYMLFDFPGGVLKHVLIANERHALASAAELMASLSYLGSLCIPAALGASLETTLMVLALTAAVRFATAVVGLELLYRGHRAEPMSGGVRAQLAYAVPLGLSQVTGYLNGQADKVLIGLFFAAEVFAEYSMGAREIPLVTMLPYTVASVLMPRLVKILATVPGDAGRAQVMDLWHASIRKVSLMVLPIAVFFLATAETFVAWLFTRDYLGAADPLRIYLLLLPLRVTAYGIMIQVFGQPRLVFRASVLAFVVNLALSVALVWPLGVLGPPVGSVLAQVVAVGYYLHHIRRLSGTTWRTVFPWRPYLVNLVVGLAAAVPAGLLAEQLDLDPAAELGVLAVAYAALYIALATATRVLSPQDLAYLRDLALLKALRKAG